MRQPDLPKKPNPHGWLWWLALLIAITGYIITYLLKLDPMNPDLYKHLMLTAVLTFAGTGVCAIAATAHLWMQR